MSAIVIPFDANLAAADATKRRALAMGYSALATAQFIRASQHFASLGKSPAECARRAVPHKSRRNGDGPVTA